MKVISNAQAMRQIQEGDKILFEDRKEPLTVTSVGEARGARHATVLSSRGTRYMLQQNQNNPNYIGLINFNSTSNPSGSIDNLRIVG